MTIDYTSPREKGLTLIELLITTAVLSILIFTIGYGFMIGLKLWDEGYDRSDIRTGLSQALQLVSKHLRQAKSIDWMVPVKRGFFKMTKSLRVRACFGAKPFLIRIHIRNCSIGVINGQILITPVIRIG